MGTEGRKSTGEGGELREVGDVGMGAGRRKGEWGMMCGGKRESGTLNDGHFGHAHSFR